MNGSGFGEVKLGVDGGGPVVFGEGMDRVCPIGGSGF